MGKYCNSIPPSHVSSSNEVLIKFQSDGSVTEAGFQMEYNPIGAYGVITSPGFPGNYDSNLDLSWLIQVQNGQLIDLIFLHFELYSAISVSCGGHYAESCEDCPQGNGASWCNGDCNWINDQCVLVW